jgi:hypothetical protein
LPVSCIKQDQTTAKQHNSKHEKLEKGKHLTEPCTTIDMTITHHELVFSSTGFGSASNLARELSRVESSLLHVTEALNNDNEELDVLDEIDQQDGFAKLMKSPHGEVIKLQSMSKEINCLSLAKSYINAIKKSSSLDGMIGINLSMKRLVELESQLRLALQSHHEDLALSSMNFKSIYREIRERHEKVQKYMQASAVLNVRKTLKKVTYPSQNALQFILSELDSDDKDGSGLKAHISAIRTLDDRLLATELVRPIVRRVRHHFLTSGTIPQEKVMKMPHLIIAYLRKVIPHVAPIVKRVDCEVHFYHQINTLIQHVLFQRGYFERIGDASPVTLTNLIQEVLKFDVYINDNIRSECSGDMSSLTELLICKNTTLVNWWIKAQRNHAIHLLDSKASEVGGAAIISTTESFFSLVCSQRIKISILKERSNISRYLKQIMIPTCMHYLNLQHKRATALRNEMDTSTIYNLSDNIDQWIIMIENTSRMAQVLSNDHNEGSSSSTSDLLELHTMSESFEKFSDAMVQECAHRYIDLLMERSAFSSFLMTAGHLLSHGSSYHQSGMEGVFMILNVWSGAFVSNPNRIKVRDDILSRICTFLQQQLLEVVLDESLEMTAEGCEAFRVVVEDIIRAVNGSDEQDFFGRLNDICRFMLNRDSIHQPIYNLSSRDEDGKISVFELETDGTLYEEVESMIRGKGYVHLTVSEACSILNRVHTLTNSNEQS